MEGLSLFLFGEEELLVENFEFLHCAFFQVGVGFFLAAGAMTAVVLKKLNEIKGVEQLQLDEETGSCSITAEDLSKYLPTAKTDAEENTGIVRTNLLEEISMDTEERAARSILMRVQVMKVFTFLPDTFRLESLLQASFAQNLLKLVKVSPLTWIYLVPALSLANEIDLSHEVINAAPPNAAESVGFFFSTQLL